MLSNVRGAPEKIGYEIYKLSLMVKGKGEREERLWI